MTAGRPPKPTKLKEVLGNPGKRRLNKSEPKPPAASYDPPEWLDEGAQAFWREYSPWLIENGLLTKLDVPMFAAACEQHSLYRRLMARVIRYPYGKTADKVERRAYKALTERDRIFREFGFSPTQRSKLYVERDTKDPFEEFLGGKK